MITEKQVEDWVWLLDRTKVPWANAKAQFHGLERRLKAVEADLKKASSAKTAAAKEIDARSSQAYNDFLDGLEIAEAKFWQLEADRQTAEIGIETWRSLNANRRGNV